jgi:hypothetical protein
MLYVEIRNINIKQSLNLLKENALNADFNVATFVVQKLIKQNDVNPINSQPKKSIIVFPDATKKIILITKNKINNRNLSTKGSYLKYANAYMYTNSEIVVISNIKLNAIVSIKK